MLKGAFFVSFTNDIHHLHLPFLNIELHVGRAVKGSFQFAFMAPGEVERGRKVATKKFLQPLCAAVVQAKRNNVRQRNSCPINITVKLPTTKLEMALMPTFRDTARFRSWTFSRQRGKIKGFFQYAMNRQKDLYIFSHASNN